MGKVWRAHHTGLKRDDALKVLPDAFASDPDRLARFRREAQVLASLNHPNIAHVYGLEQSDGVQALVMELVEGPTLADRIAQGRIPVDEALPIAKQIAEALEAAHEQGIIHRDLKPANIKVTTDGVVKVLDFGLAKLAQPEATAGQANVTAAPTITSPAMITGVGVILGTAAYMAPEQAKGREADKRSDIWAFGSVLYEMLTGKRPFDGDDVSDTLANVLRIDPDWTALPSEIPPAIRTLLQSCLTKDRRRRIADISTVLFVLEKGASLVPPTGRVSTAPLPHRSLWLHIAALTAGAMVVAAVTGTAVWFATRTPESVSPRTSRLLIAQSRADALTIEADHDLAIAPDGSRVIYVGNNGTQLFVRALDALAPAAVFTGAPSSPFVSPDGQWIGFIDSVTYLKKVAVTGGPAITLATVDAAATGAIWAPDDTIIFSTQNATTGLQRIGATGGPTTVLTRPDRAQGEADHVSPELLPGGRAVLFTVTAQAGGLDAAQVAVLDVQTGTRKILVRGGSHARYVPSGHLVYVAAGTLRAVAFDLAGVETRGTSVPVIPDAVMSNFGDVDAVVAGDGTLAYVSGGAAFRGRSLVWVDRQGRETPIPAPPRGYTFPRLSPDGTRVAVFLAEQETDIWVWDLGRTTLTRVTSDLGIDIHPVWTPDGRQLIFTSTRAGGVRNLFSQAADGIGAVGRLTDSPNAQNAGAVSPDGRRLIFTETAPMTGDDVMQVELDGTRRVTPLVRSPFAERNGAVSPDGRWLAYEANDSGRFEIYVRPFPEVNRGPWQVSTAGGTRPFWTRSGLELMYSSPAGAVMRVGVERAPSWAATTPTLLVKAGYFAPPANFGRAHDISPDGQRLLMIKGRDGSDQTAAPASLIVVQHWTEELKRLVPTN